MAKGRCLKVGLQKLGELPGNFRRRSFQNKDSATVIHFGFLEDSEATKSINMNFLKSIFISSFMMLNVVLIGVAGLMILQGGNLFGWMGVILNSGPIMMVLGWLILTQSIARTSRHFPVLNVIGAFGVGLAGWSWFRQDVSILPVVLALAGWIGFLLYAYWYSRLGRNPSEKLKIGNRLPKFTLKDVNDETVNSDDLTSEPAILMFYRGNWCPLCMAQIKELASRYRDLEVLGVRIALISPQPHNNTVELAKKFDVNFDFLTDEGNVVARMLGIQNPHGLPMGMQMMGYDSETVLPTVIITDENGKIIWTHETDNYRVRPEPDVFLDVLRSHGVVLTNSES